MGLIPSTMAEDSDVSTFKLDMPDRRTRRASQLKSMLENSQFAKFFLLIATMLGTSMVIGDGVLTPCISGTLLISLSFILTEIIRIRTLEINRVYDTNKLIYVISFVCNWRS